MAIEWSITYSSSESDLRFVGRFPLIFLSFFSSARFLTMSLAAAIDGAAEK